MPCDTIQRSTVKLEAANLDLLVEGLTTVLGVRPIDIRRTATDLLWWDRTAQTFQKYDLTRKTLNVAEGTDTDAIKRAYATAVVRTAAKRFNWTLAQQDARHFAASKRF